MSMRQVGFLLLASVALILVPRVLYRSLVAHRESAGQVQSESTIPPSPQRTARSSSNTLSQGSSLARPPAAVASRNDRRSGFAWILRQFGASESLLDRFADEDLAPLLTELKERAAGGDPSAVNILGWVSYQRCSLGRNEEQISGYEKRQLSEAGALPADEAAWVVTVVHSWGEYDRKFASVCAQLIDSAQISAWVLGQAERGDAASRWLLSQQAGNVLAADRLLRDAATGGFPQAQFELARGILWKQKGTAASDPTALSAMTLLCEAADSLPAAEANLAVCEYRGCKGAAPDISAALTHAREAANNGNVDALLEIGPHLSAGQVSPDEVAAWTVIRASLQQRGCGVSGVSVGWMKFNSEALSTAGAFPGALKLASQIWEDHGRQMMTSLGCIS